MANLATGYRPTSVVSELHARWSGVRRDDPRGFIRITDCTADFNLREFKRPESAVVVVVVVVCVVVTLFVVVLATRAARAIRCTIITMNRLIEDLSRS